MDSLARNSWLLCIIDQFNASIAKDSEACKHGINKRFMKAYNNIVTITIFNLKEIIKITKKLPNKESNNQYEQKTGKLKQHANTINQQIGATNHENRITKNNSSPRRQ